MHYIFGNKRTGDAGDAVGKFGQNLIRFGQKSKSYIPKTFNLLQLCLPCIWGVYSIAPF